MEGRKNLNRVCTRNVMEGEGKTRLDTRQSSRGWLGRSGNAKIARNSEMLPTYRRTDRPTRQGVELRVRN